MLAVLIEGAGSMAGHVIHELNDGLGAAMCGPVFLNIFYAQPTVERLERLRDIQRRVMCHDKHLIMTFIDPRVGKEMQEDARKKAKEISHEMDKFTHCNCFVVLGTGFFASMVRSVIAGVQLFARHKQPWKVCATIDEAIEFTRAEGESVNKVVDVEELRVCVRKILSESGDDAIRNASV